MNRFREEYRNNEFIQNMCGENPFAVSEVFYNFNGNYAEKSKLEYFYRRMRKYMNYEDIVIFGAGYYGKATYDAFSEVGLERRIRCFCDNKWNSSAQICGLPVLSPDEAVKIYYGAMFIVTPKTYEDEIISQLTLLGVDMEHISTYIVSYAGSV